MKIDAATAAFIFASIAIASTLWATAINLEQAAQIRRLEVAFRSLCGPGSPGHHTEACAQFSLPLVYPPSPFSALIPARPPQQQP